jgi:DnaJ-domain-containing protein 1
LEIAAVWARLDFMSMSIEPDLHLEVIKLLLQVAWADHEVQPAERSVLLSYAREHGMSMEELEELSRYVEGEAPLPPPNLGLLRQHKEQAMAVVCTLLGSDKRLKQDESEILAQLEEMLGGSG